MKALIVTMAIALTGCAAESEPEPDPNAPQYVYTEPDPNAPQYIHDGRTQVTYIRDEINPRVCFGIFSGSKPLHTIWGTVMVPCNMLKEQPTVLVKSTTRP